MIFHQLQSKTLLLSTFLSNDCLCFDWQGLTVQVEEVRIRATYSHRKRIPITEGFVEVKDGGKWRQICNQDWNEMNSRVICGMYGFPGEKPFNVRPYK